MKPIKIQWYLIKNNILPVLYLILMASVITLNNKNLLLSSLISSTLIGVKLISIPFQTDSEEKLDKFYKSLPISKKDYIISRYSFLILIGIIGILITLSFKVLILSLWQNYSYTAKQFIIAFIIGLSFYIITISLQLPLYYKYGSLRANLFSMIPVLIFLFVYSLFVYTNNELQLLDYIAYIKNHVLIFGIIILFISIFIITISYYVSMSIDKERINNER